MVAFLLAEVYLIGRLGWSSSLTHGTEAEFRYTANVVPTAGHREVYGDDRRQRTDTELPPGQIDAPAGVGLRALGVTVRNWPI
jgi:hypothetical protein